MNQQYYLARSGKIFGPYGEPEIDALRASNALLHYSWYWDTLSPGWQPVDPAPECGPPREAAPSAPIAVYRPKKHETVPSGLSAVCHNHRNLIQVRMESVTDDGCELWTRHDEASPLFVQKSNVILNLFDEKTGASSNVEGRVSGVSRRNGEWVYRVRWNHCPEMISAG